MKSADYPLAVSKARPSVVRELVVQYKVGKFTACARTEACFDQFLEQVREAAIEVLRNPVRLLMLPHLHNSIARRIPSLSDASRVLLEGFVSELIIRGDLQRVSTVSKDFESYQAVYSDQTHTMIVESLSKLRERILSSKSISVSAAARIIPRALAASEQNVHILMGVLVYRGLATTDAAPGVGFDTLRVPFAPPRL